MATNIKISELNPMGTITSVDFFPLVDSSSMTTFRSDFTTLDAWTSISGSSLTSSYAKTASVALNVPEQVLSSSWASASFQSEVATQSFYSTQSKYTTQSLYSTQSNYTTQSLFATQSLYATQSLFATSSLTASKVLLTYIDGRIPYWDSQSPANSYLNDGYDHFYIDLPYYVVYMGRGARTPSQYSASQLSTYQYGGFVTDGRVIAKDFVGTDFMYWEIPTSSIVPSGSYSDPQLLDVGTDLSTSLNKKWIRIAASDSCSYANSVNNIHYYVGRVLLRFTSGYPTGTNVDEYLDLDLCGQANGILSMQVRNSSKYNVGLIEKIRLGNGYASGSLTTLHTPRVEPAYYLDVMFDGIGANDPQIRMWGYSTCGLKFNNLPTVDVPIPITSSFPDSTRPYVVANAKFPGYYAMENVNAYGVNSKAFVVQGARMGIGPIDYFTSSNDNYPRYGLDVSGSINANSYHVTTGSAVVSTVSGKSGTVSAGGKTLIFTNGILTSIT